MSLKKVTHNIEKIMYKNKNNNCRNKSMIQIAMFIDQIIIINNSNNHKICRHVVLLFWTVKYNDVILFVDILSLIYFHYYNYL